MPGPQDKRFAPLPQSERQVLDDPNELFDLVDEHDNVIGRVRRGDAHSNPALIHRSVQILVFASDRRLLLQRRSAAKDLFPGYYCASASGHVISGDGYLTTAERELAEELGIAARLTPIGKALIRSEHETEHTMLYVARSDGPYSFHPTETVGGALVPFGEVWDGVARGTLPVTPALRVAVTELRALAGQHEGSVAAFVANLESCGKHW